MERKLISCKTRLTKKISRVARHRGTGRISIKIKIRVAINSPYKDKIYGYSGPDRAILPARNYVRIGTVTEK